MVRKDDHPRDDGGVELRGEVRALREQLRRLQLYLGTAFAALGLVTLVSIGLLTIYGVRLSGRILQAEGERARLFDETAAAVESLSAAIARQQQELGAIRHAANDDLVAMREAHRKLSAIRDPSKELGALREANEALWTALAAQRADLLEALEERETGAEPAALPPAGRFRLGRTSYRERGARDASVAGFVEGEERIHRATSGPASPGELVIELTPDPLSLGDPYELAVRLVNDSNRPLDASSLRLDWSLDDGKTGGTVPLGVTRIEPRRSALLYMISGRWTSSHDRGPASVTATLTLEDGARLANTLQW